MKGDTRSLDYSYMGCPQVRGTFTQRELYRNSIRINRI